MSWIKNFIFDEEEGMSGLVVAAIMAGVASVIALGMWAQWRPRIKGLNDNATSRLTVS